ncbi:putative SP-containing protein [Vairimorpha necatrix]|uniref:SP-containing protein n=1 Tax=Vairimorpha necatrix TaxID=6039 RepID=A0AAX4JED8_9MICR
MILFTLQFCLFRIYSLSIVEISPEIHSIIKIDLNLIHSYDLNSILPCNTNIPDNFAICKDIHCGSFLYIFRKQDNRLIETAQLLVSFNQATYIDPENIVKHINNDHIYINKLPAFFINIQNEEGFFVNLNVQSNYTDDIFYDIIDQMRIQDNRMEYILASNNFLTNYRYCSHLLKHKIFNDMYTFIIIQLHDSLWISFFTTLIVIMKNNKSDMINRIIKLIQRTTETFIRKKILNHYLKFDSVNQEDLKEKIRFFILQDVFNILNLTIRPGCPLYIYGLCRVPKKLVGERCVVLTFNIKGIKRIKSSYIEDIKRKQKIDSMVKQKNETVEFYILPRELVEKNIREIRIIIMTENITYHTKTIELSKYYIG